MSGESEATKIDQTEGRLSVNILLLVPLHVGNPKILPFRILIRNTFWHQIKKQEKGYKKRIDLT